MRFINFNGDKLSKLSLGTASFGLEYGIANKNNILGEKEVNEIIDLVYSKDINLFDTAQIYGDSEAKLGKALANKNAFIVSKISSSDFNQEGIKKSIFNLQKPSIFAMLLHDNNLFHQWGNKEKDLIHLSKEKNQIKYFGISIYNCLEFDFAINCDEVDCIEIPFNIFDQRAIKEKWLEMAERKNKLLIIRSVFLQGLLLMDAFSNINNFAKKPLKDFFDIAKKLQYSKLDLALSFVDTLAKESILLFGCDNILQGRENIKTYNNLKELKSENIATLQDAFSNIDENIYNPIKWKIK